MQSSRPGLSTRRLCELVGSLTCLLIAARPTSASAQTVLFQETFRDSATTAPFIFGSDERGGGNPCLTATSLASQTTLPNCSTGNPDPSGSGALRLTTNALNQRGFVIYNLPIQSQFGLSISFDFFAYNGTGADGLTFFLLNANANPRLSGSFGGSLGYAQRINTIAPTEPVNQPGLLGGYVGIGFDEFGNFANDTEGRGSGSDATCVPSPLGVQLVPDSVTVRGPGSGQTGYCYVANSGPLAAGIDNNTATTRSAARRTARVTLTPGATPTIQVEIDFGAGFQTVIAALPAPPGFPDAFKFGFASSTGDQTNFHEVQNLVIRSLAPVPQPQLGIAKQVGVPVDNKDGTFTIPYLVTVQNSSEIALDAVQVADDLVPTFTGAVAFAIVPGSVTSSRLQVNPNYNGRSNVNLLTGTDRLAPRETATVNFSVLLTPGAKQGTYFNTAIGTARDPAGNVVRDTSTDGVTPDANRNGSPGDDSTPAPLNLAAQLRLVKRITAAIRGGVETRFSQFVDDPSDLNDTAPGWSQLSPIGIISGDRANPFQSGDEIEYTIYYLSDGNQSLFGASICDAVPTNTKFVRGSQVIRSGSAQPTPGGLFFSPLAPLPPNNACTDRQNPNGSAIFDLGTVPSTPSNNAGFARFRVRID